MTQPETIADDFTRADHSDAGTSWDSPRGTWGIVSPQPGPVTDDVVVGLIVGPMTPPQSMVMLNGVALTLPDRAREGDTVRWTVRAGAVVDVRVEPGVSP